MQRKIVSVSEREIINMVQRMLGPNPATVIVPIGDDCAVYRAAGAKEDLVFTTDMMHEDVHFQMATHKAEDVGWKGVCESLSILERGRDFEESKKRMEIVLKTYVRSLFRGHKKAA